MENNLPQLVSSSYTLNKLYTNKVIKTKKKIPINTILIVLLLCTLGALYLKYKNKNKKSSDMDTYNKIKFIHNQMNKSDEEYYDYDDENLIYL